MDTYADNPAELIGMLSLRDVIHIGHSTGGGEVARYVDRHGMQNAVKTLLISAVPPLMLQTAKNPAVYRWPPW